MRVLLRFIHITIVGILLTALVLCAVINNITLNKNTVKKQLDKAGVYDEINKELQNELKNELNAEFAKYPELNVNLDELIDETVKPNVLKEETEYILDQLYDGSETLNIDTTILLNGYRSNLNEYLYSMNIKLPAELDIVIDELLESDSEKKVDISENAKDITDMFNLYKNVTKSVIVILAFMILVLVVLSLVVSTEKLKVIYKPLFFSAILLFMIRFVITKIFEKIEIPNDSAMAKNIIITIKDTIISNIDKFAIAFVVFGIIVLVTKIILSKKEYVNEKV